MRAEPEDPLHRAVPHHKETERGLDRVLTTADHLLRVETSPEHRNVPSDHQEAGGEEAEPDQEGLPRSHVLQRGRPADPSGEYSWHT